jgi:hypothetical protein
MPTYKYIAKNMTQISKALSFPIKCHKRENIERQIKKECCDINIDIFFKRKKKQASKQTTNKQTTNKQTRLKRANSSRSPQIHVCVFWGSRQVA